MTALIAFSAYGPLKKPWNTSFYNALWPLAVRTSLLSNYHMIVQDFKFMELLKAQINLPFLVDLFMLLCWCIWTKRNDLIFKGIQLSATKCKSNLIYELILLLHRVQRRVEPSLVSWIKNSMYCFFISWASLPLFYLFLLLSSRYCTFFSLCFLILQ